MWWKVRWGYQRRGRKFHPIRLSENNKRGRWPCYVFREIICVRCRSNAPDDFVIEKVELRHMPKYLIVKIQRDIMSYWVVVMILPTLALCCFIVFNYTKCILFMLSDVYLLKEHDEVWILSCSPSIRYILGGIDPRRLLVTSLQQYIFFLFTSIISTIDNWLFCFQLDTTKEDRLVLLRTSIHILFIPEKSINNIEILCIIFWSATSALAQQ